MGVEIDCGAPRVVEVLEVAELQGGDNKPLSGSLMPEPFVTTADEGGECKECIRRTVTGVRRASSQSA